VGPYLRLYGRSAIANSQLQNPEFQHFFIPGVGSLPYVVADIYHRVIVSAIGDPLCHESKWGYITELFMKEFPDAFFYHISEKYAKLLTDLGYWVNDVGAETTLQVCGVGCSSGFFRPTAPTRPLQAYCALQDIITWASGYCLQNGCCVLRGCCLQSGCCHVITQLLVSLRSAVCCFYRCKLVCLSACQHDSWHSLAGARFMCNTFLDCISDCSAADRILLLWYLLWHFVFCNAWPRVSDDVSSCAAAAGTVLDLWTKDPHSPCCRAQCS